MELLLPKKYISWRSYDLWKKNPERFKREYFEQGKKLDTKYLRFGKNIALMIENGDHKSILPHLVIYDKPEYKIETVIKGVPILCYLDGYDPERNIFGEYKTGKNPWTLSKVQKHGQLLFYAVALRNTIGKMPECCDLHWLETSEEGGNDDFWTRVDGKLKLTGNIKTFRRRFDHRELDRMENEIVQAAQEISKAYELFINQLI